VPLLVGVDAGGTRTVAAAQRGEDPPTVFTGEGANANLCGIESAAETIARAVARIAADETPSAIGVGAAGAGRYAVRAALTDALRARFPETTILVTDDAQIALRGAIGSGDAIALIAGTGSIAYAEIGVKRLRAGGGGFALGDEGSGYAIGSAALRLLLRAFGGRSPRDPLLDALSLRTGANDAEQLIAYAYGGRTTVAAVAAVAPIVLEYADAGERSAVKIVQIAAGELFDLVRAIVRAAEVGAAEVPLAFCGGLLAKNGLLTYLIETRVAADLPNLRIVKDGGAPYLGALANAARLLGSQA
jgi:N-acetylmuramic acid 6-phosphate etherase